MACCSPACVSLCRKMVSAWILAGFVLSLMSLLSCEFMVVHTDDDGSVDVRAGLVRFREAGSDGECRRYDRAMDRSEGVARASAVAAAVLSALGLLVIALKLCCTKCYGSRLLVTLLLASAVIAQGSTFAFFNSDQFCDGDMVKDLVRQDPCRLGKGGTWSLLAMLAYFVSMVAFFCIPRSTIESDGAAADEHTGAEVSDKLSGVV